MGILKTIPVPLDLKKEELGVLILLFPEPPLAYEHIDQHSSLSKKNTPEETKLINLQIPVIANSESNYSFVSQISC